MPTPRPSVPARLIQVYLKVVWVALWISVVIFLIAVPTALWRLQSETSPPSLAVPVKLDLEPEALLGDGTALAVLNPSLSRSEATIRFAMRDRSAWIVYGLVIYAVLAAIAYGLRQVRALMRDVMAGRAFRRVNAARLRRIGILVLAWQILAPAIQYAWSRYVLARFDLDGSALRAPLNYAVERIALACAVLVLAEIFREAARLQEDNELTV